MYKVFKEIKETNSTLLKKIHKMKYNCEIQNSSDVWTITHTHTHTHTPKRIKRKPSISHDKTKNNKGRKEVLKAGKEK